VIREVADIGSARRPWPEIAIPMATTLLSLVALVLAAQALAVWAIDPEGGVPEGVLRYVAKAVTLHPRSSALSAGEQEDLRQEILARLLDAERDLDVWKQFGNRDFATAAYERFRGHLIAAIKSILDRVGRTPRVEDRSSGAEGEAQATAPEGASRRRKRRYLEPDRPLTDAEARGLGSREPNGREIDLMLDMERALGALPRLEARIVHRRLVDGDSWANIAADCKISVAEVRIRFRGASARLTEALKSYNTPTA
jgi:DNA-directed RNA polymerase specialized sigma24 family protein